MNTENPIVKSSASPRPKQRYSNLELYRIIVMLLIVAHHYVVNSGLMDELSHEPLCAKSIYFYLFGMWGKTGINCFVLITGYFMCKSHITLRKFMKLLLQIEFYNVAINAVFALTGYHHFGLREAVLALLPVRSIADGFTSCFLVFYLFIPFLNVLVSHLDRRQHALLVALCLFTYTLMGTFNCFHVTMNYVSWFCVLYFIASYIRIYGFLPKLSTAKWGGITCLSIIVSVLSVLRLVVIAHRIGADHFNVYRYVADSNVLFAVTTSVSSFMFFKGLRMGYHRWINTVAACTFGVLLIHANSDTMRQWLWRDAVDCAGAFHAPHAWLYATAAVLLIFAACAAVDYVRIHTVEKWAFKWIEKSKLKINIWSKINKTSNL